MSEARAALIFWFFFIKEKEHPPAALRAAHCAPGKEHTPGLRRCCALRNDGKGRGNAPVRKVVKTTTGTFCRFDNPPACTSVHLCAQLIFNFNSK
jgi:hypothetical protein